MKLSSVPQDWPKSQQIANTTESAKEKVPDKIWIPGTAWLLLYISTPIDTELEDGVQIRTALDWLQMRNLKLREVKQLAQDHTEIAHPFHRCDLHLRLPENATIAPCQQIYQRLGYCICNNTVCERRVTQSAMNCTSLFPAPSQALRKHGEIAQSMSSLSRFCFSCKRASSSSANEDTARLQAPAIEQRVVRATS
ncbi:uncharacterized protein [Kogia breviceps]|uniref:uncharacterized protein isoform X3 n=1 Tax=Kogia breviceps TaxID=27615 RepID=UPI0034D2A48E